MRIAVTGAGGFVGSRLIEAGRALGHEMVGIHRGHSDAAAVANDGTDRCELTDRDAVVTLLRRCRAEVILHAAGRIPARAGESPYRFFDDNVRATLNVLDAARETGVMHVVLSSSMSVYGDPTYLPVDERHPTVPSAAYGLTKLEGELYGRLYAAGGAPRVTVLRYSGIFGEGQRSGAIPTFIDRSIRNEPISLHSGGRPTSDYVWVEDVARANFLAIDRASQTPWEAYNIGSGVEVSVVALAETIRNLVGSRSEVRKEEGGSPRDFRFAYDITRAKAELGYRPATLEDALRRFIVQKKGSGS